MSTKLIAAAAVTLMAAAPTALRAQHHHHDHPHLHVDHSVEECSVRFSSRLTQASFHRFVREFGSVSAFKQAGSPTGLRKGQLSIGIEQMTFTIDDHADAWNDTFAHPDEHHALGSRQQFPKIKLAAGVTDDLEVGAFWTRNLKANYGWLGIDAKYRPFTQEDGRPVSLALRGAYTKTLYVRDMDMHALTTDVSIERKLWRGIRAYGGVGADAVYARETTDSVRLNDEAIVASHAFAGAAVTLLGRVDVGAEFTLGARPSMQLQVAARVF